METKTERAERLKEMRRKHGLGEFRKPAPVAAAATTATPAKPAKPAPTPARTPEPSKKAWSWLWWQ